VSRSVGVVLVVLALLFIGGRHRDETPPSPPTVEYHQQHAPCEAPC
jgi:hypothetical protein